MERRTGLGILREADTLRVTMPSGRNPWFVVSALAFGVPWLASVIAGSIVGASRIPDGRTALVWIFVALAVLALTGLLDVLAVVTIWLAFYAFVGTETLEISAERAVLRRRVWGIGVPLKFGRGLLDSVVLLAPKSAPGRVPHPALELRLGRSRARIGAGLAPFDADRLAKTLEAFIAETGRVQSAE
jgi:hypothetical protein